MTRVDNCIVDKRWMICFLVFVLDGSLSDTAVGLPGIDMTRRKNDQRSPKSETTSRDRDRFGAGMGKKSSSTSQLSATGKTSNFIKQI